MALVEVVLVFVGAEVEAVRCSSSATESAPGRGTTPEARTIEYLAALLVHERILLSDPGERSQDGNVHLCRHKLRVRVLVGQVLVALLVRQMVVSPILVLHCGVPRRQREQKKRDQRSVRFESSSVRFFFSNASA